MKGCRGQRDKPSFIESVSAYHVNKWERAPMPQAPHLRTFCIHSSFVWALEITWNIISSVKWVACFSEVDGWGVHGGRFARVDFNPLWYTWRSREAENTSFDDSRLELVNKHVQTFRYTIFTRWHAHSNVPPLDQPKASGTRVTCVLTKGLKGRKEEMTPLQWQSTFWSIFLSSSRLHGLILPFFTHFMRLFSFLTVCSCFLKPSFYSVVTIFCNFFFSFTSLFFFTCYTFFCHKDNLEIHVYSKSRDKKIPSLFRIPSSCVFLRFIILFSMIFAQHHSYFRSICF